MTSSNSVVGLIFSKDRAMQLDALLRSFFLHCRDHEKIDLHVLYKASSPLYDKQYKQLLAEYKSVRFITETSFKRQVLPIIRPYRHILFSVDDNLFVRNFSLQEITRSLNYHPDALGFTFRLGKNTRYNYNVNQPQDLPDFAGIEYGFLRYYWVKAKISFNYALEVTSVIYRVSDVFPLISQIVFSNPITMEREMAKRRPHYARTKYYMLCPELSITFCNQLNKVQNVALKNRASNNPDTSVFEFSRLFDQGYRIDVEKFCYFISDSPQQEMEYSFFQSKKT